MNISKRGGKWPEILSGRRAGGQLFDRSWAKGSEQGRNKAFWTPQKSQGGGKVFRVQERE